MTQNQGPLLPPPLDPERRSSESDRWTPVAHNLSAALAAVVVIVALAFALVYVIQSLHL